MTLSSVLFIVVHLLSFLTLHVAVNSLSCSKNCLYTANIWFNLLALTSDLYNFLLQCQYIIQGADDKNRRNHHHYLGSGSSSTDKFSLNCWLTSCAVYKCQEPPFQTFNCFVSSHTLTLFQNFATICCSSNMILCCH